MPFLPPTTKTTIRSEKRVNINLFRNEKKVVFLSRFPLSSSTKCLNIPRTVASSPRRRREPGSGRDDNNLDDDNDDAISRAGRPKFFTPNRRRQRSFLGYYGDVVDRY